MNVVFDTLMVLVGLIMMAGGIHFIRMNRKGSNWPMTTGKLKNIEVTQSAINRGSSKARHIIKATYTYSVAEKEYQAQRIHSIDSLTNSESTVAYGEKQALKQESKLKEEPLYVTYNPENPAECYLLPVTNAWNAVALIGGILVVIVGLGRLLL